MLMLIAPVRLFSGELVRHAERYLGATHFKQSSEGVVVVCFDGSRENWDPSYSKEKDRAEPR